ncbi:hypothetical protein C7M52_00022 [Mixta theicola]|nr:hypothetical protein C7M52_00022 [Mixta theicola]
MMRLLALLLAASLATLSVVYWRLSVAESDLAQAQRAIGTLSAGIESRDRAINRLNEEARESAKREATLRLQQGRASSAAINRELQIQKENDANPTLRSWSATALPDDVIRLHTRPAFSNARAYLDWLSACDQLSGAGKSPEDAGRSGGG